MPAINRLNSLPALRWHGSIRKRRWAFAFGLVLVFGASTYAQSDSTTSSPATAQNAVTANTLAAPPAQDPGSKDGFVESTRRWAEKHQLLERISGDIDGWYPRLGGMTRGSGIALGPGYRTHPLGSSVLLDVSGAISMRFYKAVDVHARWLQAWNQRAELWTDYRFEDYPQEDFYGIGPDSLESMRTDYRFRASDFIVRAQLKPRSWLRTGVNLGYLHPSIGPGTDRDFPSLEQLFEATSVPGLLSQPDFIHAQLFVDVDYRDAPGNPKRGGFYHAAIGTWSDRSLDTYNFRRFDSNASQFLPITADEKHILSGRLGVSFVNNIPGDRVPFYFLPYVGGTDTIRSYREFRFKDENAVWFGAEYRWIPIKWVSGAVFADFGKVAEDWQDVFDASDLKQGYGFGLRVHSTKQTFAKIDFGFGGGEGRRIFIKLGPSF
jgi:hypothetical protein